jgi:hypothetical protein
MSETSASNSSAASMSSAKILSGREGYSTWKFKMRMYLMHEELWYAVAGYPASDKMDDATKAKKEVRALNQHMLNP